MISKGKPLGQDMGQEPFLFIAPEDSGHATLPSLSEDLRL